MKTWDYDYTCTMNLANQLKNDNYTLTLNFEFNQHVVKFKRRYNIHIYP